MALTDADLDELEFSPRKTLGRICHFSDVIHLNHTFNIITRNEPRACFLTYTMDSDDEFKHISCLSGVFNAN